jgi:hypothetical protein
MCSENPDVGVFNLKLSWYFALADRILASGEERASNNENSALGNT